ncbi:hypothetical protein H696_03345 [Fonticula alba]|uniref:p22-phox n=1 Tax=Fonticula alba TaxID=691883 RepID=A0A058Z6G1_FONAL|nr:hypothetical protein H696_03345 [Fonticula alba]KCV69874.1 hypothetical protein H696_03345 [Fonticula alba]|eukprot:XP_009495480.1 hypothetical protein H696_03345 [Fonticula alba]
MSQVRRIFFHVWGRYAGLGAAGFYMANGIFGMFYPLWQIAAFCIAAGVFTALLEYPFPGVQHLGFFSHNLFVRAAIYFLFAAPGFALAPTFAGALFMLSASVIYFYSAFRGEAWTPPGGRPALRSGAAKATADRESAAGSSSRRSQTSAPSTAAATPQSSAAGMSPDLPSVALSPLDKEPTGVEYRARTARIAPRVVSIAGEVYTITIRGRDYEVTGDDYDTDSGTYYVSALQHYYDPTREQMYNPVTCEYYDLN